MLRVLSARERISLKTFRNGDCLMWTGANNGKYGKMSYMGRLWFVHRAIFHESIGISDMSNDICHTCDNPLCVNIDHLFEGSRKDNMQDCSAKGRIRNGGLKGSELAQSKLNEDSARYILRSNKTRRELATMFKVSPETIKAVVLRRNWKHVTIE